MSDPNNNEPENGWFQNSEGRVFYMKWLVDYGMRVFQPDPDAEEEEVIGMTLYFIEPAVKNLTCVGDHKYAAPNSLHIQFQNIKKKNKPYV